MEPIVGRPQRIGLDDVARATGVSKATVCRALLGRSRVAAETRTKVLEAAQRLGYRPDPVLSALTRHRWASAGPPRSTYHLAIVRARGVAAAHSPPPAQAEGKAPAPAPTRSTTIEGIRQRSSELGLLCSEWQLHEHDPDHLAHVMHSRGVDGVVVSIEGPVHAWDFPWDRFAVVTVGHDQEAHATHSIVPDWYKSVALATAKAAEAGCRRIGFASFYRRNPEIDDLLEGSIAVERARMERAHGPQPAVFRYNTGMTGSEPAYHADEPRFGAWLKAERPDVVIDTNRLVYWWMRNLGVRIPDDCSYATTLGDKQEGTDGLSGVNLRREHQGRSAVELLYNLLQVNHRGMPAVPLRLVVACGWEPGRTLRTPATA